MVLTPDVMAAEYVRAGCQRLIVHAEACTHLHRTLANIASLGATAGVALNPATPADAVAHVLDLVDLVLVMTVNPGFGGQRYIATMEPKIAEVAEMIHAAGVPTTIDVEVDGGIGARHRSPRQPRPAPTCWSPAAPCTATRTASSTPSPTCGPELPPPDRDPHRRHTTPTDPHRSRRTLGIGRGQTRSGVSESATWPECSEWTISSSTCWRSRCHRAAGGTSSNPTSRAARTIAKISSLIAASTASTAIAIPNGLRTAFEQRPLGRLQRRQHTGVDVGAVDEQGLDAVFDTRAAHVGVVDADHCIAAEQRCRQANLRSQTPCIGSGDSRRRDTADPCCRNLMSSSKRTSTMVSTA